MRQLSYLLLPAVVIRFEIQAMRDRQTDGELYTDKLHSIIILFVQIFKIIFKSNNIHWIWCKNCKI